MVHIATKILGFCKFLKMCRKMMAPLRISLSRVESAVNIKGEKRARTDLHLYIIVMHRKFISRCMNPEYYINIVISFLYSACNLNTKYSTGIRAQYVSRNQSCHALSLEMRIRKTLEL